MLENVDSTWNSSNYQAASPEAFASGVDIILQVEIVITVKKVTIGIRVNRSRIGRLVKVSD